MSNVCCCFVCYVIKADDSYGADEEKREREWVRVIISREQNSYTAGEPNIRCEWVVIAVIGRASSYLQKYL